MEHGAFVISLDFELHWGVRASRSLESYRENLLGSRQVIPRLLQLFTEFGIHATWATVGFLFCADRAELLRNLPDWRPNYRDPRLCPYRELDHIGNSEADDPFHYAPSLIRAIAGTPNQEIGTHTFSHFYCLEAGSDMEAFEEDLAAAMRVAEPYGVRPRSIIFPRNQYSPEHMAACARRGIVAYRGNPNGWFYKPRTRSGETWCVRGLRLADAYVPMSGDNTWRSNGGRSAGPVNVPASRFLRPCRVGLEPLERLRLRRILGGMASAARGGSVYHLWWHPHNFGVHIEKNLEFLRQILLGYARLRDRYGFASLNMGEVADNLRGADERARAAANLVHRD
jgi:peptidoglycan/xylan/chitin deacetylase (PgdA/CDA1 family)